MACTTTQELEQRRLNNAKIKIKRLIAKYPQLVSVTDTSYTAKDTIVKLNTIYVQDSVYLAGSNRIDTIFSITELDSIYKVLSIMSKEFDFKIQNVGGGQVRATYIEKPRYIYETDTVRYTDTIFKEKTITAKTTVIDTKESFWWSLWFQIKGWIWFILVALIILVILRVIFKYVG
jgi:hypothetical protein